MSVCQEHSEFLPAANSQSVGEDPCTMTEQCTSDYLQNSDCGSLLKRHPTQSGRAKENFGEGEEKGRGLGRGEANERERVKGEGKGRESGNGIS